MIIVPASFEACLEFIQAPDRDGNKDDRAPGETFATAYGVTQMNWDRAVEDGVVSGRIEDATPDQCGSIFRTYYWNVLKCSALPEGVGLMVFNDGVLTGVGHAAKLLQRIVGATVDGSIGPETLRRAHAIRPKDAIDALVRADDEYLATLRNAPRFLNGWTRREKAAGQLAYQMAGIPAVH